MKRAEKSFAFCTASVCAFLILCFTQVSPGQKIGTATSAPKGGSLAIERVANKTSAAGKDKPNKYQKAAEKLGLSFDNLLAEYNKANKQRNYLEFKSIVLIHLIAASTPEQTEATNRLAKTISLLQNGKSLIDAVEEGFSLTESAAKKQQKQAAKSLDDAMKSK